MSDSQRRRCLADFLREIDLDQLIPRRSDHEPSEDELLRMIEGTLSDEQRHALEARLEQCPYGADRVAIVRAALHDAGLTAPRIGLLRD